MDFVRRWSEKTEIGVGRFIHWLGVTASKFYDWRQRYGCLEVGGQNGMGGQTVSRVVYLNNGRWLDQGGFGGALAQQDGGGVDRWQDVCTKGIFHPKLVAGTDVTEKVNQALKDAK